jgi:hypothetical protein
MLKKHEVRSLLEIKHRDTINEDLRVLGWSDCEEFDWAEVRKLLEMRLFLGLRPGINSREEFLEIPQERLTTMFVMHGLNVENRLQFMRSHYQQQYQTNQPSIDRVTVKLVLNTD